MSTESAKLTIKIRRQEAPGKASKWVSYDVPAAEGATVASALNYIREELDPSLAFRCGCRFQRCGLCAVEVNGRQVMACRSPLQEGLAIAPLSGLPVLKDLVIERDWLLAAQTARRLYLPEGWETPGLKLKEPVARRRLLACRECLACLSACPAYSFADPSFAGPYFFVKLAQQHLDPRNREDRRAQAREMGIERCRDCRKCRCPNGVAIYRDAVKALLEEKF